MFLTFAGISASGTQTRFAFDAVKHLEALCEIEELDIVQWVAGDGAPSRQDWTWLYDKIDALGKGQIRGGSPEAVTRLWEQYASRKLFFSVGGEVARGV
ncbi:MAG: hypothetical protein GW892_19785 [Armatimonadetes bacterium]|nr:hypothetical protein [Armatimonadota bacterium]NCP28673.1 hypothetical protein [Armatimonadota bacterium]